MVKRAALFLHAISSDIDPHGVVDGPAFGIVVVEAGSAEPQTPVPLGNIAYGTLSVHEGCVSQADGILPIK